MLLVLLLAVASSACAALSTVFKHRAAQHAVEQPAVDERADGEKLPRRGLRAAAVAWVANPTFAIAMVFDGLCVVFQILALKYGSLSVVQPVLCMSLVISLGLNHVMLRTRPTRSEILHSLTLVAGLVMFLLVSDSISAHGETAIGRRVPAIILAVVGGLFVLGAVFGTRSMRPRMRARALAASVAIVYATTAGLMKSTTQISHLFGLDAVLTSWQLWVLIALAACGLALNQVAFAAAPLNVVLPVVASLDPLFSVLIGVSVYGDQLRDTPLAVAGEVAGLTLLLYSVVKLSSVRAAQGAAAEAELAAAMDGGATPLSMRNE